MILTLLRISWLTLVRDRLALGLTFVLPVLLFTFFAALFSGFDEAAHGTVATALVLEGDGPLERRLAERLEARPELGIVALPEPGDRAAGRALVAAGRAAVAVVLPASPPASPAGGFLELPRAELLVDASEPLAAQRVAAVLQAEALRLLWERGGAASGAAEGPEAQPAAGPLRLVVEDVLGAPGKRPSIAFFAAGIGVMFLLFSAAGRSAILLDEQQSGVLARLLTTRLDMTRLLAGRWLFLTLMGCVQVTLMFVWGSLFFGLDLWTARHLVGFAVMTVVTAAAAAAFGLALAAGCRTRAQLHALSSLLVLVMSALGGSMFPRFLMPQGLRDLGLLTFNAWALDGYQKVFWYEAGVTRLLPEILVLSSVAILFFLLARLLARRWELI